MVEVTSEDLVSLCCRIPVFWGGHGFWNAGEKGAPTLDARELRCPLNAGRRIARVP
jgi:hypothetical protein